MPAVRWIALMLLAGCTAGRATFEAPDETTSRRYPDSQLWKTQYGWNARLWGRVGGSLLIPLDGLFSDRLFIDIPLPEEIHEGLEIDLETFGHPIDAGARVAFGRDDYRRYRQGQVVVTKWDAGLRRVSGNFSATDGEHRIRGWFTAVLDAD